MLCYVARLWQWPLWSRSSKTWCRPEKAEMSSRVDLWVNTAAVGTCCIGATWHCCCCCCCCRYEMLVSFSDHVLFCALLAVNKTVLVGNDAKAYNLTALDVNTDYMLWMFSITRAGRSQSSSKAAFVHTSSSCKLQQFIATLCIYLFTGYLFRLMQWQHTNKWSCQGLQQH